MKQPTSIRPAEGKLGVLLPGHGRRGDDDHRGRRCSRGSGKAVPDRLADADGDDPARPAHRQAGAEDLRLRPAREPRSDSSSAGGTSSRTTPTRPPSTRRCSSGNTSTRWKTSSQAIRPMKGVFYPGYVKRLHGTHIEDRADQGRHGRAGARRHPHLQARPRVRSPRRGVVRLDRGVHHAERRARQRERRSRRGSLRDDPGISNAQIYAWACMKERVPFANGAPNLCVDFPAAWELARETHTSPSPARTSRPARR